MREKTNLVINTVLIIGILATIGVSTLLIGTHSASGIQLTKFNNVSNIKSPKSKKIVDKVMTWGEFLDSYSKTYFYASPNANPRPDISKDHKVRVVTMEYPNGVESKNGFYGYGLTCNVFDAKTKEILTSAGFYKDKKK